LEEIKHILASAQAPRARYMPAEENKREEVTEPVAAFVPPPVLLSAAEEHLESAPEILEPAQREVIPIPEPEPISILMPVPVPEREAEPSWFATQTRFLLDWLLKEGNIWVTAGILVLLIGFGLLFSYIAQMGWFSLELRLASSAAAGIVMTAFGWKQRERRRTYALILQGGGIGVLYVVFLAGAKLGGGVIPVPLAVGGMLILSVFTVILALLQDFEPLAFFALLGGFAAPILVSTGSANHVALFSIYSLLNLEILALSLKRDWRKTRRCGLIASFVVGGYWGFLNWREAYFISVEPFIILYFLTYNAIAGISLVPRFKDGARFDFPLALTLPFAFLSLQMAAASHTRYGIAITCLGMGFWYLALGRFTMKKAADGGEKLSRLFLVFCVLFSNLSLPFLFKQAVSSAVWAIEGALLIVLAARMQRKSLLAGGVVLHLAALVLYNFAPYFHLPGLLYSTNMARMGLLAKTAGTSPFLLTGFIFAFAAFVSGYFITECELDIDLKSDKFKMYISENEICSWAFTIYGTVWWWLAVGDGFTWKMKEMSITAFGVFSLGAAAAYFLSKRLEWRAIRVIAFPAAMLALLSCVLGFRNPSISVSVIIMNWCYYSAAFLSAMYVYKNEEPELLSHAAWGVLLFVFLIFTGHVGKRLGFLWNHEEVMLLLSFIPVLKFAAAYTRNWFSSFVPGGSYRNASLIALATVTALNLGRFFSSFSLTGTRFILGYIPLLNPLELWQLALLTTAYFLLGEIPHPRARNISLFNALPVAAFLWINQIAARAAWWYYGERVIFGSLRHAPHFHAIIGILWGLTALFLIFRGKRARSRALWGMGAGLLVLDMVKLLLIDLSSSATVARIFAFLLLGGLFLLIGWVAPLPPKSEDVTEL